jgi:hypothetical protein
MHAAMLGAWAQQATASLVIAMECGIARHRDP